jgi:hypothetical protein
MTRTQIKPGHEGQQKGGQNSRRKITPVQQLTILNARKALSNTQEAEYQILQVEIRRAEILRLGDEHFEASREFASKGLKALAEREMAMFRASKITADELADQINRMKAELKDAEL